MLFVMTVDMINMVMNNRSNSWKGIYEAIWIIVAIVFLTVTAVMSFAEQVALVIVEYVI